MASVVLCITQESEKFGTSIPEEALGLLHWFFPRLSISYHDEHVGHIGYDCLHPRLVGDKPVIEEALSWLKKQRCEFDDDIELTDYKVSKTDFEEQVLIETKALFTLLGMPSITEQLEERLSDTKEASTVQLETESFVQKLHELGVWENLLAFTPTDQIQLRN